MEPPKLVPYMVSMFFGHGAEAVVLLGAVIAQDRERAAACAVAQNIQELQITLPLAGIHIEELRAPFIRAAINAIEGRPLEAGAEVVRLVPREEPPVQAKLASDNLRPVSTKFRCKYPTGSALHEPACGGIPSAFCPYCEAVVEEVAADPA